MERYNIPKLAQPQPASTIHPRRRAAFGLGSAVLHGLAIGALVALTARPLGPDPAENTTIEMVFLPAEEPESAADAKPQTASEEQPEPSLPAPLKPKPPAPRAVMKPAPKSAPIAALPRPVQAAQPVQAQPTTVVDPSWQASVASWLAARKTYPEEARRRGEEGRVSIRFTVDRSGHVLDMAVAGGSGSTLLDAAAMALLRQAVFPPFPASMTQARITITTSVRYSLKQ